MELLYGMQKAHLVVVAFQASDTVEAQNIIANNALKSVAVITLANHAKMVWIVWVTFCLLREMSEEKRKTTLY